eukprot:4218983-Prymnesium_polylepis.1
MPLFRPVRDPATPSLTRFAICSFQFHSGGTVVGTVPGPAPGIHPHSWEQCRAHVAIHLPTLATRPAV